MVNMSDWSEMLINPLESPYVAFGNNFSNSTPNIHSFQSYFLVQPDIPEAPRQSRLRNWWNSLPTWAHWTIGAVVVIGLVAATMVTGGLAGIKAAAVVGSKLSVKAGAAAFAKSGAVALGKSLTLKGGFLGSATAGAVYSGVSGAIFGAMDDGADGAASGFGIGAISGALGGFIGKGIGAVKPFTASGANVAFQMAVNALSYGVTSTGVQYTFNNKQLHTN
jgi:hypothetical protein